MANYRKPTEKETEKLNKSRQKMIEGIEGEKDIFSKMMPTMAKAARDDIRAAKAMRESVPASAREGEAYQNAGYKKGGKVKKFAEGGYSALEKFGLDAGVGQSGLSQTSRTPEERALGIGLREGSPDFKKAVETFNRQKRVPGLPSERITQQTENPIIRKAKDMAASVMSRTPSALAAKKGMEMARKYPRGSEGESVSEEEMGMKKGGTVSKLDMQKAGFYDKDKTKSERQKIVKKVTTKPQRIAIVEKAFSSKNMKSGGSVSSASRRADGCAIRGKTRA
jgi:hypothetical protein